MKIINHLLNAFIGILLILVFNYFFLKPTLVHYIVALIILFSIKWLFSRLPNPKHFFQKFLRKRIIKIGILNGSVLNPNNEYRCEKAWTEVTPGIWNSELKRSLKEIKFKKILLISTSQINDSFTIIINPFGEVYPEKDPKIHATFYDIRDYILNGGFFVCTGLPFFHHHNTINSTKAEWAIKRIVNNVQSLTESLFFYTFGAVTTGNVYINGRPVEEEPIEVEIYQRPEDQNYTGQIKTPAKVKRFRALTSATSDYIPFIRQKDDKSFPVAAIPYGQGFIIHAGMHLYSDQSDEFKTLVVIIKHLLITKFKNL